MKIAWYCILGLLLSLYAFFLYETSPTITNLLILDKIKLSDFIGLLVNIASIVFAVCGAWVALVFPKALEKLKDNDLGKKEIASNDEVVAFKDISICSALSLLVIIFLLAMNYLLSLGDFSVYTNQIKIWCFYIISFLYFFQVYILLITAKTTIKVFASYGLSLANRSADKNLESQGWDE